MKVIRYMMFLVLGLCGLGFGGVAFGAGVAADTIDSVASDVAMASGAKVNGNLLEDQVVSGGGGALSDKSSEKSPGKSSKKLSEKTSEKSNKKSKRKTKAIADSLGSVALADSLYGGSLSGDISDSNNINTTGKTSSKKITPNNPADTTAKATKPEEEEIGSLDKEWPKVDFKHYVGVKGGYGIGSGRLEPTRDNEMHLGLYNFGVSYMFDAVSKGYKYVGAVQVELEYMQKGFTYHLYSDSQELYSRDYAVIQLPLLWQPYLPLSKNGYSRFFINAGPFVNYIIDPGSERKYNKETGVTTHSGLYKTDPLRDNRFEYGLAAGAGFKIGIRRFAVTLEFRYYITFSDLMKGVEKYPSNTFFRTPIDQMNLSLMLIYRLTK